ncbi:hypothetical protein C162_27362 [Paenibacillus sp. FSL R7-269]|nr:hypothetical protein C162_27362 [Paenibacillus sp. FSL R7-269]
MLGIPFTFEYAPGDQEAWLNVGGVGLGLIGCPEVPKLDFTNSRGQLQPIISLQVDNIHEAYDPDRHMGNSWGGWPKEEG